MTGLVWLIFSRSYTMLIDLINEILVIHAPPGRKSAKLIYTNMRLASWMLICKQVYDCLLGNFFCIHVYKHCITFSYYFCIKVYSRVFWILLLDTSITSPSLQRLLFLSRARAGKQLSLDNTSPPCNAQIQWTSTQEIHFPEWGKIQNVNWALGYTYIHMGQKCRDS